MSMNLGSFSEDQDWEPERLHTVRAVNGSTHSQKDSAEAKLGCSSQKVWTKHAYEARVLSLLKHANRLSPASEAISLQKYRTDTEWVCCGHLKSWINRCLHIWVSAWKGLFEATRQKTKSKSVRIHTTMQAHRHPHMHKLKCVTICTNKDISWVNNLFVTLASGTWVTVKLQGAHARLLPHRLYNKPR